MRKSSIAVFVLAALLLFSACGGSSSNDDAYSKGYSDGYSAGYADGLKNTLSTPATPSIAGEASPAATPTPASQSTETDEPAHDVLIYDDEYVSISYRACELDKHGKEQMLFYVVNKTDGQLSFQADSFAINGESLGHISGSDRIAAQSKGKVAFDAEEAFPTLTPTTISGVITVIDFSKSVLPERSYDVSFVNVEIQY